MTFSFLEKYESLLNNTQFFGKVVTIRNIEDILLMPYTDDDGRLNNFAKEPKMYQAEPPNKDQQRNYIFLGIAGAVLVTFLVVVAAAV
ncbi:MAG: photosystem II assembly protein Psb34 [Microcoleus sp.]